MTDKRLERALKWCRENRLKTDRLDLFNREQKSKRSKKAKKRNEELKRAGF